MLKFDETLQNIIFEDIYNINYKAFKPFVYKNVIIAASNLNKDPYHLTNRLKQRSNQSLNDVFVIVQNAIDKYFNEKELKQYHGKIKSFSIVSKKYSLIVNCTIEPNKTYDMFELNSKDIFKTSKYICFIFTVLDKNMKPKITDKLILTEEIGQDIVIIEI